MIPGLLREAIFDASAQLGHSDKQITKVVYQRVGKRVKPTT